MDKCTEDEMDGVEKTQTSMSLTQKAIQKSWTQYKKVWGITTNLFHLYFHFLCMHNIVICDKNLSN